MILIRHAETPWSRAHRHTGRTDIPLTPEGERAAARLATALTGCRLLLVATSPRIRAIRTADLAGLVPTTADADTGAGPGMVRTAVAAGSSRAGSPWVYQREIWPELAEWDYGDYEGRTTAQIRADVPGWTVWTGPVPGGESAEQVGARADAVLARLRPLLDQGDVALVGHAHMLRVLIARWLGLAPTAGACFVLDPAGLSELGHEHGTRALLRLNTIISRGFAAAADENDENSRNENSRNRENDRNGESGGDSQGRPPHSPPSATEPSPTGRRGGAGRPAR